MSIDLWLSKVHNFITVHVLQIIQQVLSQVCVLFKSIQRFLGKSLLILLYLSKARIALQILLFDETSCSKEVLMQVGVMDCCKFIEELLQIDSLFNEVILSV